MFEFIRTLRSTNPKDYTDGFVEKVFRNAGEMGSIIATYWPPPSRDHFPNLVVRATAYSSGKESITNFKRLRYPPREYNTKYQRVSTPERPMFYATLNNGPNYENTIPAMETCFRETFSNYDKLIASNDSIAFSLWYIKEPIRLATIFTFDDLNNNKESHQEIFAAFEQFLSKANEEVRRKTIEFMEFLSERFTIPVEEAEEEYKPSGIVSQYMIYTLNKIGFNIDGIIFKSAKSKNDDLNIAILPNSCDDKLECVKVINCILLPLMHAKGNSRFNINSTTGNLIEPEEIEWDLVLS
ncbi:MAG: hypothetical protein IPO86_13080 [Saprospiraceae bacterium]|nr:hypothetical protein [Saprospiraceae bacterium]